MPVDAKEQDNGLIVAALFALVTNWDETETRSGRRGDYQTTGASMYRLRTLDQKERDQIKLVGGAFGLDVDDDELDEMFSGEHEYQVSYACNRFATTNGARGKRLTANELRTLERARTILANKEDEAARFLTTADRRVA